jgi:antitoxin (DNA-binding transcriptional repressor) of toxin-antitoxin stability system
MRTRFIGIKQFRQDLSTLYKEARKKGITFIVMSRSVPVFKVTPMSPEEEVNLVWYKGKPYMEGIPNEDLAQTLRASNDLPENQWDSLADFDTFMDSFDDR